MASNDRSHLLVNDSFINRIFPFPSRLQPKPGTRQHRQVRAIAAMLITTTLTTLFWTLVVCGMYLHNNKQLLPNILTSVIILGILLVQLISFYVVSNVRISAVCLTISYFFMVAGLVLLSGGFDSPSLVLLMSSPIISFRIGGRDEGIMNTIFVGLFGLMMLYAKYSGFPMENMLNSLKPIYATGIAWVVSLTVISTCLATYDIDE